MSAVDDAAKVLAARISWPRNRVRELAQALDAAGLLHEVDSSYVEFGVTDSDSSAVGWIDRDRNGAEDMIEDNEYLVSRTVSTCSTPWVEVDP